ncbi:nuclease [Brachionus plicatilis]|uniref:Nuclease n=1 Tax=Brachionus plicatilis TaxID=10195 RepID=A0A3M7R4K2_BRAPC|nr:nuclease [Brachionus plicatilis]
MFKFCVFFLILIYASINESKWYKYDKTKAPFVKKEISISPDSFTVMKVADGDTITVRNNSNWDELLPLNSKVKLAIDKIDLYGRSLAVVINNKKENVNKKMVELGLAAHYMNQRGCDDYKLAQSKAKVANIGIWSDKNFTLPWDYRKKMGIGARGNNSKFINSHKRYKYESKNAN